MALIVTTETSLPVFELDKVKKHLVISGNDEDEYITDLIEGVYNIAELITNRTLLTTKYTLFLDSFPQWRGVVLIPKPPLQTVDKISYYDNNGAKQTLAAANYQYDNKSLIGRLMPKASCFWPDTQLDTFNAVEIEFTAGWVDETKIPKGLKRAMLFHIQHLYDNKETVALGTIAAKIPGTLDALYAPHRVHSFF